MAKKHITVHGLLLAAAAMLLLGGCGNDRRQMERNARGYLEAMGNYRVDEAVPYASRHTREVTIPIARRLTAMTDPEYIKSNTPADITIRGAKRLTDSTAVVYYHKHTPITEQEDSLALVREEGRWVADVRLHSVPLPLLIDSLPSRAKGDSVLVHGRYQALRDLGSRAAQER